MSALRGAVFDAEGSCTIFCFSRWRHLNVFSNALNVLEFESPQLQSSLKFGYLALTPF